MKNSAVLLPYACFVQLVGRVGVEHRDIDQGLGPAVEQWRVSHPLCHGLVIRKQIGGVIEQLIGPADQRAKQPRHHPAGSG